jgi:DNA gyrase subunit A
MEIGIVKQVSVDEEMRNSYLDYAMSVIIARALPDVRDGLKPSQRRILVAMHDLNLVPGRPYRKCAKIAGDTSGNYHPHGEAVIYPTLVRLAQTFNMRYPLVDGQGNFGSVDGDPPAAMRYTESRMTAMAVEMLADLDKDTVDWIANYDGTRNEPTVLPGRFPNLICNGSTGIAVGMATNIPPHNLGEVVGALLVLIDNPEASVDDLLKHVAGPDFPTGGILITKEKDPKTGLVIDNLKTAYGTGHGRVLIRAKAAIEERRAGFYQIVVTELPYQVNKATLQEKIAELVREKRIEGISDMRDESDRQGMRLVIELKREASPRTVLNHLYKHTSMQTSFGINMLALVAEKDEAGNALPPQPRVLTLKRMLAHFLEYRHDVLTRRTRFELEKARARIHILEGLKIALDNLDAVIQTIRESASAEAAFQTLQARFTLSEIQARAILDMQLRRLAALERQQIIDEYEAVLKTIEYLEDLLANPRKILLLVRDELLDLKKKFGDPRRTEVASIVGGDLSEEDLVPNDEMIVTISGRGYVKRLRSDTYRVQIRGGKGVKGQVLREEDALRHLIVANARDNLLFFTNRGKVYQAKAYQIPEFERTAKGIPLINVIDLDPKEFVTAVLAAPDFENSDCLVMVTRQGEIKKTSLHDFESVRRNGLKAMDVEPNDELCWVKHSSAGDDVILVSEQGKALRFPLDSMRTSQRASGGMRGLRLMDKDKLAGMDIVDPDANLLVVTEHGFGKYTPLKEYRPHGRGTMGIATLNVTKKTGRVASVRVIRGDEELMLISASGIVIRTSLDSIIPRGRKTQGVTVMNLKENDRVACIEVLETRAGGSSNEAAAPILAAATETNGTNGSK